jgi:hypothetical protein
VFLRSGDAPGLVGEAGSRAGRESDPALVLPSARGASPLLQSVILFLWLGSSVRSNPRDVVGMIALLERHRQQRDNSASDYVRYIPFCHAQTAGAIDLVSSRCRKSLPKPLSPYYRAYWRAAFTPILIIIQAALNSGNRTFGSVATRRRMHHCYHPGAAGPSVTDILQNRPRARVQTAIPLPVQTN